MRLIIQRVLALTVKELLALLRDAASRAVLIGPPIIQLLVFGYAATFDLKHVPFVVYNQDQGRLARDFIARFEGSPSFSLLRVVHNQNELGQAIDDKSVLMAMDIVPGICGILTLLVSMLTTGLSVAREREMGTFDQLLVTPLRPTEILLGKSLPGFIVGFAEGTFIVLVSIFWFHVPFTGSVLGLYIGLFCFLLATVGIGLMISSLAVTQQQGLLGVFLFMVPAIVLSGFATPIANMPQIVQYITLLDPLRYFLIVLRGSFLEGAGVSLFWPQYWPLAVIGIVSMIVSGRLFRRRLS